MQAIRHILVPVDFYKHSETLAEFALYLAKSLGAKVTFLHVNQQLPDYTDFDAPTLTMLEGNLYAHAEKKMAQFLVKQRDSGCDCQGEVLSGQAVDTIIAYAKDKAVDMIVISTHGAQGIEKVLLGSVADRVVKGAHCPILLFNPFKGERGYEVCSPMSSCIQPL